MHKTNTETHLQFISQIQSDSEHQLSMESPDKLSLVEESLVSSSRSTSSSSLPSLQSAVTEPLSQKHIKHLRKDSPSLCNFLKLKSIGASTLSVSKQASESDISATSVCEEDTCASRDDILRSEKLPFKTHPLIDPDGWIKCASDNDPWNSDNYFPVCSSTVCDGVLTRELISKCSIKLDRLPDSKAFALSRLHIDQKGLKDIAVLEEYNYFQYIDASRNCLTNLQALCNCSYLIYLNASHNHLTAVLDFKPPRFLTHVNLESNEIKEIGHNLSSFWSLRHLDLSSNFIEKIDGLGHLKFLKYLNLSRNKIKRIENMDCVHLEELNLESNEISACDTDKGLHMLENIKVLMLAHNKLSSLVPFQELFSLKKLDISHNFVTDLSQVDNLRRVSKCYELDITENPVCASIGYRELVIHVLPNLRILDSVPVNCSERVAAKMLLEPDIFTSAQHLRTKLELWNQLASREVSTATVPCDKAPVPLVALVGTFMNGKEDIAKELVLKYPNQVYRCKKYTTLPLDKNYDPEILISVPIDEFNTMMKAGKLLIYYKEVGYFFGVCQDEISTCIVEGKIGIIDTILEAALVMRYSQLYPFLVLSVAEDIESYGNKLKKSFMEMDLWNNYLPPTSVKLDSEFEIYQKQNTKSDNSKATLLDGRVRKTSSSQTLEDVEFEGKGEDNFTWTWSMESSVESLESEPDHAHLDLVRGTEMFVRKTLHQQATYVEMHNLQPGLFHDTVLTDDVDKAVKKIGTSCYSILKNRMNQKAIKDMLEESTCAGFIQDRVDCLLQDFINVSF